MRRWRWAALVLLVPFALSAWLVVWGAWFALWGVANLAMSVPNQSLTSLSRAVDGAARSAGVLSWVANGWGALAPAVPAMEPLTPIGASLKMASVAGLELAPVLPAALGAEGTTRYLISGLNDAELFGSGGAPLQAVMLEADNGTLSTPISGSVSAELNPRNVPYPWDVDAGLPWYAPNALYPFANSNYHPDFGLSGPNMRSAWDGLGFPSVDGVVTLDVYAVAAVLEAIGPIESEAYGLVTADNLVRILLVDAYRDYPGIEANARRQALNAQLQSEIIDELKDPQNLMRAAVSLWRVIPGRHVQAWMADPSLQRIVTEIGAGGELSRGSGDVVGVFSQSGPSKLSIFQERSMDHEVVVAADGSAQVTQTTTFTSAVPADLFGDPDSYRGYLALVYRQRVAFRIPETAQDPDVRVRGGAGIVRKPRTGPYPDEVGGQVMWQGQDLRPGDQSKTVVTYTLPPGTFGSADDLEYWLDADPQATVSPTDLTITVTFPSGQARALGDERAETSGAQARWTGVLDRPISLRVGNDAASSG